MSALEQRLAEIRACLNTPSSKDTIFLLAEIERSRAQCWRLLDRERDRATDDPNDPRLAFDVGSP
jgi:hypothetical protein